MEGTSCPYIKEFFFSENYLLSLQNSTAYRKKRMVIKRKKLAFQLALLVNFLHTVYGDTLKRTNIFKRLLQTAVRYYSKNYMLKGNIIEFFE